MSETDGPSGLPDRTQPDPELANLDRNIRRGFAEARAQGPAQFAEFLNRLSGRAEVAITGTVYVPRLSRAFGDWILVPPSVPSPDGFEIIGQEQIDTTPPDPFIHQGHEAFTIGHSYVRRDGGVVLVAEQAFEDGEPRILYPDELARFDLNRVRPVDMFIRRELRHDERFLRNFFPDAQTRDS